MKTEIERFNPCFEALEFRKGYATFEEAWNYCPRGDWMLWLAEKLQVDRRLLVLTGGHCANTVRHLMGDERSTKGVDACIAYGEGRIGEDELDAARYAAWDAARAAYAAYAAFNAAYAAAYAADAANAAAYAAYSAAARIKNQKATADICRKYLTKSVMEKIKSL